MAAPPHQTVEDHGAVDTNRGLLLRVDPWSGSIERLYDMSIDNEEHNPIVGLAWHGNRLYGLEIFPYYDPWTTDSANFVTFERKTGTGTEVLTGFASLPNGLVAGPDGALYTSNWGDSFTGGGDGSVLRIVP